MTTLETAEPDSRTCSLAWCSWHISPKCPEDSYRHYENETPFHLADNPGQPLAIYRCCYAPRNGPRCTTIEVVQGPAVRRTGFSVTAAEAHHLADTVNALTTAPGPDSEVPLLGTADTPLTIKRCITHGLNWDYAIEIHQRSDFFFALTPAESPRFAELLERLAAAL